MADSEKNDLFYVCSLIEYVARITQNKRGVVANCLGHNGVVKELKDAGVNHSLSFEQVGEEVIERYDHRLCQARRRSRYGYQDFLFCNQRLYLQFQFGLLLPKSELFRRIF